MPGRAERDECCIVVDREPLELRTHRALDHSRSRQPGRARGDSTRDSTQPAGGGGLLFRRAGEPGRRCSAGGRDQESRGRSDVCERQSHAEFARQPRGRAGTRNVVLIAHAAEHASPLEQCPLGTDGGWRYDDHRRGGSVNDGGGHASQQRPPQGRRSRACRSPATKRASWRQPAARPVCPSWGVGRCAARQPSRARLAVLPMSRAGIAPRPGRRRARNRCAVRAAALAPTQAGQPRETRASRRRHR